MGLSAICDIIVNVCCNKEKQIVDDELHIVKDKHDDKNVNSKNSTDEYEHLLKIEVVPKNKQYFNHTHVKRNENRDSCECMKQQPQNLSNVKRIIIVPHFNCSCTIVVDNNNNVNNKYKTAPESDTQISKKLISEEETEQSRKLFPPAVTDFNKHSEYNSRKIDDRLDSTFYIPCCKKEIKKKRNDKNTTFPMTSTKMHNAKCTCKQSFSKSCRTLFHRFFKS
ncbi:hypothetical protein PUN28_011036 [Cardiocondyla obscurior]|uniref:Uncharacterized protein n=1 Tax=Cardiocondyla obscurior TaxID=286306 RepID=A0AAW2FPM0_9HYME